MQRELSRRSLLAGTAAAVTASAGTGVLRADLRGAIRIASDAELLDLTQAFAQALAAYQTARARYNQSEKLYFARRPRVPQALTESGPLGHLLPSWLHWSAAELRQILKNPEHRDLWHEARAALALARNYEAGVRRAKRETGVAAAEAAHDAAIDHLADVGQESLPHPGARSRGSRSRHTSSRLGANRSGGTLARTGPRPTNASLRKFSTRSSRWRKRGGVRERPQALTIFHRVIKSGPVGNVDKLSASVECWKRLDFFLSTSGLEQEPQRRLDQLRHGAALPRYLAFEVGHDLVIDIQRRFHLVLIIRQQHPGRNRGDVQSFEITILISSALTLLSSTVNGAAARSNFTLLRMPSQPCAPLNAVDFTVWPVLRDVDPAFCR